MGDALIQQGLDLMTFGMGTVFVFLAILVVATKLMSRTISRFFPESEEPEPAVVPVSTNSPVDARTMKVIQAALDLHRGRK